tara:strand:+ start:1876 stop:2559 length:684 start_codon:yes stop_codon:yes gene_type:complete
MFVSEYLQRLCDYTMLDPNGDIEVFLKDALEYKFAAVCVLPVHVSIAKKTYPGVVACAAGGFPNGDGLLSHRIAEIEAAISDGADEIDVVIDFDSLMNNNHEKVAADLSKIRQACGDKVLKVILETPELDLSHVEFAARLSLEFGADFIKTCTGRRGVCTPLVASVLSELLSEWLEENKGEVRGLKISGGVREIGQAEGYLDIIRTSLGDEFVTSETFRFGTSRILR